MLLVRTSDRSTSRFSYGNFEWQMPHLFLFQSLLEVLDVSLTRQRFGMSIKEL